MDINSHLVTLQRIGGIGNMELEDRITRFIKVVCELLPHLWEATSKQCMHWHINNSDSEEELKYMWEQHHAADVRARKKFNRKQEHNHPFYPQSKCKI